MKIKKILFAIAITCFVFTGCKNDVKEVKKEVLPAKKQNVSLAISGMTCEIGCAKTIQSKLSKKEGVLDAKVIFKDSIANIEFDANTTSKKDLIAFVDGIAGGKLYKASESSGKPKDCGKDCKEACKGKASEKECKGEKKECKETTKKACCTDKKS